MSVRSLIGALVLAVVASMLAAGAFAVPSAAGVTPAPAAPVAPARAATPSCADVVVVGIDGNAERPRAGAAFGPTVSRAVAAYRTALGSRRVQLVRAPIATVGLTAMIAGYDKRAKDAGNAVRRGALKRWRGPVTTHVRTVERLVADRAAACPEEQIVVVGYAQGASVAHRLLDLYARTGRLTRVAGALLVSDPDRRYATTSRLTGAPSAAARSTGLVVHRFSPPPADVPRATATFGVGTVCTARDLVCDPSRTTVRRAFGVARGYATSKGGGAAIKREAIALAARTRLKPVPSPAVQTVVAPAGKPLSRQLAVDVAAAARGGVRWTATGAVPGLTLSPTGVLSGTPASSGTWSLPYTVRGTTPATGARTGSITVVTAAEATGLSAGGQTSCQTRGDGTAACWGRNDYGQVGDGTTTRRLTPTAVLGSGWTQVATGGASTCGIQSTGRLSCWGLNNFGQVGVAQSKPVLRPRAVGSATWDQVAVAWHHACGVGTDASMWCWGQNLRGSLGLGTTSRSVDKPTKVGSASWRSVTVGGWHSCGIRTDGTAWCWGDNQLGQLGVGNIDRQAAPRMVGSASDNWLQLSTGYGHTCGVRADGSLRCWGLNDRGQLGDGTTTDRLVPTAVAGSGAWVSVAVSDGGTCALDSSAAVWCWGDNRYGQVSSPSTAVVPRPVKRAGAAGVSVLAAGWLHTCALRADTTVGCWGSNEVGQLGGLPSTARAALPTGTYDDRPGLESDPRVSPATVVERAIGDRPRPVVRSSRAQARAGAFTTKVMTFNVLGTQHTAPGGDRPDWAPGRIRAEWSDQLIRVRGADLLGLQESQPDQIGSLDVATGGRFGFYPGNELGYAGAPQSVMWRKDLWTLRWKGVIDIPFMNGKRPQPMVRLQRKGTDQQVYLVNVHFSPGGMEADRDRATTIVIKAIKELSEDGIPVLLTGDFNEREELYCKVLGQTDLKAAIGPSTSAQRCTPPRGIRVDQIFGSRGRFSGLRIEQGPMVQRTTDHSVSVVSFAVG